MLLEIEQRDFRDTLARAKTLGGADLVLTSPPYDDARTYGDAVSFTFRDYQDLGDSIADALKEGGQALINISGPVRDTPRGTERSLTPWRIALDWSERIGLRLVDVLAYGRLGVPGAYVGRYRQDWEPVLWFAKPGSPPFLNKEAIADDAASGPYQTRVGVRRPDGSVSTRTSSGNAAATGKRQRGTLWWYGSVGHGHDEKELAATKHPARFNYLFASNAVEAHCPPGGLVVDPFVGSGTVGLASVLHRRAFLGGDLLTRESDGKPWASIALSIVQNPAAGLELFGD